MTTARRVHLVRHAESRWNVEQRYQGQGDSGLTAAGIEQAERLAGWLVEHIGPVARVVASDLPRASATAAPFAARVGADISLDSRFREVDIGTWSGRSFAEIAFEEPELVAAAAAGCDVPRGDGETFADARARVWAAMEELARIGSPTDASTIVFTHGGPIRVAAAAAAGVPTPGHARIGAPTNCSVSTFEAIDGRWRLLHYNRPSVVRASAGPTECAAT